MQVEARTHQAFEGTVWNFGFVLGATGCWKRDIQRKVTKLKLFKELLATLWRTDYLKAKVEAGFQDGFSSPGKRWWKFDYGSWKLWLDSGCVFEIELIGPSSGWRCGKNSRITLGFFSLKCGWMVMPFTEGGCKERKAQIDHRLGWKEQREFHFG